jgi:hypothetical protein
LIMPVGLTMTHLFTMNAFDPLFWIVIAYLIVRIAKGADPRLWLMVGGVTGFAILNKYAVIFWLSGVLVGMLLSPMRRELRSKYFWLGGLIGALIAVPNFLWEWKYHFPFLELMYNVRESGRDIALGPVAFLAAQAQMLGYVPALLAIFALIFFFSKKQRAISLLGWAYVVFLVAMLVLKGKMYYVAPVYPILFAAGAVWLVQFASEHRLMRWLAPAYALCLVVMTSLFLPLALPVLSVEGFLAYEKKLGIEPQRFEQNQQSVLPQIYADMFGWQGMVSQVADFYHTLPEDVQKQTAIFANNYGDAGAVDFFGPNYGLPKAISGHQTYWLWGPRNYTGASMIVLGEDREENMRKYCGSYSIIGNGYNPLSRPEEWLPIYYCRGLKLNLQTDWPKLKHWG